MEKYLVNTYDNHWVECDSAESAAQEVIENVDDYYWDDLLDDVYGEVEICGYEYCASRALSLVDEVAYRCGKVVLCKLYSLGIKFYIILCKFYIDFWRQKCRKGERYDY